MAKIYISEYRSGAAPSGINGLVQAALEPSLVEQAVTFSTATQSAAFNVNTRFIRVHTDSICSISIGTNPTATVSMKRLAANQTEYFAVPGGYILSAVTNT